MPGLALGLIRAPVKLGFQIGGAVVRVGLDVARRAAGALLTDEERSDPMRGAPAAEPESHHIDIDAEVRHAVPDEPPKPPEPDLGPAQQPAPDPVDEPVHVSEEPVLVAEFAEPGAEDGAGSAIAIVEPWDGYDSMRVPDIERELRTAEPTVAAAVKLYEASGRARRGVLAAADRRLRA
jgi:hypothetical protein